MPGRAWLVLLALAACADGPDTRVPDAAADSAALAPEDSTPRLTLEGEGLRVFLMPSGSARPIPFGTAATDALETVTTVKGNAPSDRGTIEDCGVAYAAWPDLTLYFSRDEFAGWSAAPGSRLTTASGIGIGATRAQLDDAYDANVAESTIGVEFSAGGLAGVLESEEHYARILHMWAGVSCIAR